MYRKKNLEKLIYIMLFIVVITPRLPDLGSFATLDEPYWLSMGANFYYALGQKEFQNTIYEYQPAVTTMWIVTAAMVAYFPEYRGLGQGYLEFEKGALDPFLLERGKDPLALLYTARLIQVLIITVLFLLLFFFLKRIVSSYIAFFLIFFASFDPFFLGQSRLLDHEALLSLFVLISVLTLYIYLFYEHKIPFLLSSAGMAGLAQLTKSSAIAILLPVGILMLVYLYKQSGDGFSKAFWACTRTVCIWSLALVVIYFSFWPGMWVAPGKMLHEVYGNAFSYAFQGARLKALSDAESFQSSAHFDFSGILDLISVFFWRTTPITWAGILLGILSPLTPAFQLIRRHRQLLGLMASTAVAFILMFGIAQGRNSPHYILTSYLALNIFAGLGWCIFIMWFVNRAHFLRMEVTAMIALAAIFFFQAISVFSFYPYYYTYYNPILYSFGYNRNYPQFPYGEGLELAAQHLASLPDSKNSVALVYYARGCFSYFYPGETLRFKPYFVETGHEDNLLDSIHSADYLVIYYANQGKLEKYSSFLAELSEINPFHEVWLNGYKYVVIYQIDSIPQSVIDTLAE